MWCRPVFPAHLATRRVSQHSPNGPLLHAHASVPGAPARLDVPSRGTHGTCPCRAGALSRPAEEPPTVRGHTRCRRSPRPAMQRPAEHRNPAVAGLPSAPRETRTPTPHKQDKALNLAALCPLCPYRSLKRLASVARDALDASDDTSVTAVVTADYRRASANPWRRRRQTAPLRAGRGRRPAAGPSRKTVGVSATSDTLHQRWLIPSVF